MTEINIAVDVLLEFVKDYVSQLEQAEKYKVKTDNKDKDIHLLLFIILFNFKSLMGEYDFFNRKSGFDGHPLHERPVI